MSANNNIISKPIRLATDVAKVLGTARKSVGSLCLHPSVNKWSKYKPFAYKANVFRQDTDTSWHDRDNALLSRNYGICNVVSYRYVSYMLADAKKQFPVVAPLGTLNFADSRKDAWGYTQPTGGENAPFRLSDFNGYNHNANTPFGVLANNDVERSLQGDIAINYTTQSVDQYAIMLKDLTYDGNHIFGNMYLGICMWNNSKSYVMTCKEGYDSTSADVLISNIENIGTRFFIRDAEKRIPAGTYNVFLFASDKTIGFNETFATEGVFVPFSFTADTLTIKNKDFDVSADYFPYRNTTAAVFRNEPILLMGNIRNNMSDSTTVTRCRVSFLDMEGNILHTTEILTSVGTLAPGGIYSIPTTTLATSTVVSQYALDRAVSCRFELTVNTGGASGVITDAANITKGLPRN